MHAGSAVARRSGAGAVSGGSRPVDSGVVFDPNFAVSASVAFTGGRVTVRWHHDGRSALPRAGDDVVEIGDLSEPKQHAVTRVAVRVADVAVVVFGFPVVELEHEHAVGQELPCTMPPLASTVSRVG